MVRKSIAVLFLSVLLALFIYIFYTNKQNAKILEQEINQKYKNILYKDSINSTVIETYYPENWRGSSIFHNFTLKSGENYQIHFKEDVLNGEYDLSNALHNGARIIKKPNSDKVRIYYLDKEYQFKIDVVGDNN